MDILVDDIEIQSKVIDDGLISHIFEYSKDIKEKNNKIVAN
jgi:hypothetical protein